MIDDGGTHLVEPAAPQPSVFASMLDAELKDAAADYRRSVNRQFTPFAGDWTPPAWPTRLKWRLRSGWRWATGLRVAHKSRIGGDTW